MSVANIVKSKSSGNVTHDVALGRQYFVQNRAGDKLSAKIKARSGAVQVTLEATGTGRSSPIRCNYISGAVGLELELYRGRTLVCKWDALAINENVKVFSDIRYTDTDVPEREVTYTFKLKAPRPRPSSSKSMLAMQMYYKQINIVATEIK